jgi:hypothetical protein
MLLCFSIPSVHWFERDGVTPFHPDVEGGITWSAHPKRTRTERVAMGKHASSATAHQLSLSPHDHVLFVRTPAFCLANCTTVVRRWRASTKRKREEADAKWTAIKKQQQQQQPKQEQQPLQPKRSQSHAN